MANDFANTITLQNGDIYDIHDARIRETSTADAGKALKVNSQGELEFADATGNDCAKIYYTDIAPSYFTSNEINEIVNGKYSIVSNSGLNYFVAWLDNEELGLIHYDVETEQLHKVWYEGSDGQWHKTSEGYYSFATQEYVQNAIAGVQTGTKLYRHNLRLTPGTNSIAIITDYPSQISTMAAICAIVTHEQIMGKYYNYISGEYNNNGNIIYWCRHPGSGQVLGFYYGYLNEQAVPSAFNPVFKDLTGVSGITDTVTEL